MKSSMLQLAKSLIAELLVLLLASALVQAQALQEPGSQQPAQSPQQSSQQSAAPDAPQPQLADPSTRNLQSDQKQNPNPVGTAAAPLAKPTGVAASRPAGAVIAPAKQHRVRAIVIRVGIIVGAGVAIGTVAALSRGSSSRP